jgi:hypothetical protein
MGIIAWIVLSLAPGLFCSETLAGENDAKVCCAVAGRR